MREQYLQMRRTGQYDFGWFFQYYLENKSPDKDAISFDNAVGQYCFTTNYRGSWVYA